MRLSLNYYSWGRRATAYPADTDEDLESCPCKTTWPAWRFSDIVLWQQVSDPPNREWRTTSACLARNSHHDRGGQGERPSDRGSRQEFVHIAQRAAWRQAGAVNIAPTPVTEGICFYSWPPAARDAGLNPSKGRCRRSSRTVSRAIVSAQRRLRVGLRVPGSDEQAQRQQDSLQPQLASIGAKPFRGRVRVTATAARPNGCRGQAQ